MDADKAQARIAIEIVQSDAVIQELFFYQFEEYKELLREELKEDWVWQLHTTDSLGKIISKIETTLNGVNFFDKHTGRK